jgi:hypothetical protein
MIRAVIDCDGCHARDITEAQLLYVNVADRDDGAPGSAGAPPASAAVGRQDPGAPRLQRVDLCPQCLAAALTRFVNRLEPAARREWVRQYVPEETPA